MIIGSDMTQKTGVAAVIDKVDFTFSIRPESIPYSDRYGIRINANRSTLLDVSKYECTKTIERLRESSLSIISITERARKIELKLSYKDQELTALTDYAIGE